MKSFLFILFLFTSCRAVEFDYVNDLGRRREIEELRNVIISHRLKTGVWLTEQNFERLRQSNIYLKRFSEVSFSKETDSTISVSHRLEFEDFEDPIRSVEMTELLYLRKGMHYGIDFHVDDLVVQIIFGLGIGLD